MRAELQLLDHFPLFPNTQPPDRRVGVRPWEVNRHHFWNEVIPKGLRDGYYNYVIDEEKNLVVGPMPMGVGGDDHLGHPILAKFGPVYSAGDFIMNEGLITEIRDSSGHFQTGEKGLAVARLVFRIYEAPVSPDCEFTPFAQHLRRKS